MVSVAVGLATAIVMLATEPRLAIVWDEGYTLGREARLRDWFRGLADPVRFAKEWRPLPSDQELVPERPGRRSPASPARTARYPRRSSSSIAEVAGLVLAVRARGAARASAVLCAGGPGRRRAGPILGGLAASPTGADPPVQPHGRGDLRVRRRPMGLVGRGAGGGLLGLPAEPVRPRPLRGL